MIASRKSHALSQLESFSTNSGVNGASRKRRLSVPLAVLAAGMALLASGSGVAGGASSGANAELPPRLYVITPSSEPDQITGPSMINVYDPASLTLMKQTPAKGLKPHHLYKVPDRNFGFIAHFGPTAFVEVYDFVKDEVVATIPTGVGPRHLGFTPDGSKVYTANYDNNTVSRIVVNSMKSTTAPAGGSKPNYVEYIETSNGPYVFAVNSGESSISVLDPDTLALIKKITVGAGPFNLAHSDACNCIMTANAGDNTVSWVDMNTLQEVDRKSILTPTTVLNTSQRQRLNPRISPDGKFLWIGDQQGSEFAVFDIFTHALVTTIPAAFGADIAFFPRSGPGAGFAFGTNRYDYMVTVAKLNGGNPPTFVKQIPVTLRGPHYITFNEDFGKAYVSERPGGGCSVIDVAAQVETASLAAGPGPDQCVYLFSEKGKVVGHTEASVTE